jgi:hypothetical protein
MLALTFGTAWAGQQVFTAHYLNVGQTGQSLCLALDASGNSFVVSTVTEPSGRTAIRATKLDPNGNTVASFDFGGSGTDTPEAAANDAQGNLFIAGNTTSSDFPVTSTLSQPTGSPAFVTKLDANLTGIVASTELGGTVYPPGMPTVNYTHPRSIALDAAGNVYVAGVTTAQNFPATAGAYLASPNGDFNGFLAELPANLNRLVFATYLGPQQVAAMALTSDGSILLTGPAGGSIPVTPDVYGQSCNCGPESSAGYVSKFAPGGSSLTWATYLPIGEQGGGLGPTSGINPWALTQDAAK